MAGALEEALLLKLNPDRLFFQQRLPLPDGIAQLIRIAIDPASAGLSQEQREDLDDGQLQAAAAAYLKGVCLFPGSQGLRVLGLNDASDNKLILEHRRLLLKWLHPDRNPENRHLAERVNRAWALQKAGLIETAAAMPAQEFALVENPMAVKPRRSRFPLFLAGIAVLVLGLWGLSRIPDATDYLGAEAPVAENKPNPEAALPELVDSRWGGQAPNSTAPAVAEPVSVAEMPVQSPPALAPPAEPLPAAMPAALAKSGAKPKTLPERSAPAAVPVSETAQAKITQALAAAPAESAEPPTVAAAPKLTADQGQTALQRFLQLYRAGDLDAFMAQFSRDARTNRGGRDAIREDYARLFLQSKRRELEFSQAQWQPVPGGMRFTADYRSKVLYHGDVLAERSSGGIDILFGLDAGQVRIASLLVTGR